MGYPGARLGAVPGRTREEGAGWGRREGRRTEHAPKGAVVVLVGASSVAPSTPLRVLVLTRSDRWWLGTQTCFQAGALAPNLRRQV